MLMKRQDSLLLIIDVQERLVTAMDNPREVIANCRRLLGAAGELKVPFVITEQYPKGLGPTMVDLRQIVAEGTPYFAKSEFSCVANPKILAEIKSAGKKQVIIAGVEAHICVAQTALELQQAGYEVFVVSDASSSRQPLQSVIAFQRMLSRGIDIVTTEMVLFEWLESASVPEFKSVSAKYIK